MNCNKVGLPPKHLMRFRPAFEWRYDLEVFSPALCIALIGINNAARSQNFAALLPGNAAMCTVGRHQWVLGLLAIGHVDQVAFDAQFHVVYFNDDAFFHQSLEGVFAQFGQAAAIALALVLSRR